MIISILGAYVLDTIFKEIHKITENSSEIQKINGNLSEMKATLERIEIILDKIKNS